MLKKSFLLLFIFIYCGNSETLEANTNIIITDEASEKWNGFTGFINSEMIAETMPSQADDTLILLCGPPKMISEAVKPSLEELNYLKDNIFTF